MDYMYIYIYIYINSLCCDMSPWTAKGSRLSILCQPLCKAQALADGRKGPNVESTNPVKCSRCNMIFPQSADRSEGILY